MSRTRQLPSELRKELGRYETYPALEQRLGKSRTRGTPVAQLPKDLQEELFLRSFHCDFTVTSLPVIAGSTFVEVEYPNKHKVGFGVNLVAVRNKGHTFGQLMDAILAGQDTFLYLGRHAGMRYVAAREIIVVVGRGLFMEFPVCIELLRVLQEILPQ